MGFFRSLAVALVLFAFFSCARQPEPTQNGDAVKTSGREDEELPDLAQAIARLSEGIADNAGFTGFLSGVFSAAGIPDDLSFKILDELTTSPAFILDLLAVLEGDPYLRMLVDKQHPLAEGYEPDDLAELVDGSFRTGRAGLMLRESAAAALEEMAAAARLAGITLTASSAYRSYAYQAQVYERNVREMGQDAADRESARPGYSQHQLGLVVDFGSIDDSFAQPAAGGWMAANASRFGWSLAYPKDYEAVTSYRWESWHYRYTGKDLAAFIDNYFDGIQQYALRFIYEWEIRGST
jgi:D-alanyl-D-alanine carboxypeptidase